MPRPAKAVLERALTRLAFEQPFYATILAMMHVAEDTSVGTIATDGLALFYNPDFIAPLTDEEAIGVLAHEVLHVAYLHCDPQRRAGRDKTRWNVAADFAINQDLLDSRFTLPKCRLHDPAFKGMTAEEIYPKIRMIQVGQRCLDELRETPVGAEQEVVGRVLIASERCPGSVPAGLKRWIAHIKESRVPWERVLARFMKESLDKSESSFLPPNRRHLWDGRYLPSVKIGRRGRVVVAVDTSGSVGKADLEQFAGELRKIKDVVGGLVVMTADAAVQETLDTEALPDWFKRLSFKGGGGTDFRPVFKAVEAMRPRPDALVYLTDGFGTFPKKAPQGLPVLWCLTIPGEVPWGRKVLFDVQRR